MFVEDTSAFFSDFGIAAIVGGVACRGIFDEAYAEAFGMIAGASPSLLVTTGVAADIGAPVVIGARRFNVAAVEPDGCGMMRIRLEAE